MSAAQQELGLEPKPWECGMNSEQQAVIAHTSGPLAVAATAGGGKTRSLVNRIARMVNDGIDPARICAVTFSKKAADEMNYRLTHDLGITDARVGTWHSLALQVLREDLSQGAWQIDEKDQHKRIVKEVCGYKHLNWKRADVNKVRSYIGFCKANLWAPESHEALEEARKRFGFEASTARNAYAMSDEHAHGLGLLTFDDMLVFVARHLSDPDRAAKWAGKWDFLMQDEAQDVSVAQMVIARALALGHRNYMIVFDPAQSVYGFRGSDPKYCMAFENEWSARVVYMNRNYRSGDSIIRTANAVIAPAEVRLPVEMKAERGVEGKVSAHQLETFDDEAVEFVTWIEEHRSAGRDYSDICALYRTNAQSRALEDQLLRRKIPYVIMGGTCFYERKEVKDMLAYLRVAVGRGDVSDAVRRCINAPFRFLGKAFVDRVMDMAEGADTDWPEVVEQAAQQARIQRRQAASAEEWCALIAEVRRAVLDPDNKDQSRPQTVLARIERATGYVDWITREEGEDSVESSAASNVRELIRVAGKFVTVTELLDYVDKNIAEGARQRRDKKADRVVLMSVHASKGLEFPCVWVAGCNEDILPHARGDIEEERRLFYVAVTRARDELVCSYVERYAAPKGMREATPSRFLSDAGLV